MDLRTRKIYDSLTDAMKQLLAEKSFEEITVGELCERARTRRATFYSHFSDKYEFFAFMLGEMRERIWENAKEALTTDSPAAYARAMIDIGLSFVEENREILTRLEKNETVNGLLMTITDRLNQEQMGSASVLPAELRDEVTAQFLIGALNQCSRWWIYHMDAVSKDEMKQRMYALVERIFG